MKKFFLLTINVLFSSQHFVTAQSRKIAETIAILCSYKWLLSAEEWFGEKVPVSEWLKGTYWVFKNNGAIIRFSHAFKTSEKENKRVLEKNGGSGRNSSGFSAIPAGKRFEHGGITEFNFGGYFGQQN